MRCSNKTKKTLSGWAGVMSIMAMAFIFSFPAAQASTHLDNYLRIGLNQNLSLNQRKLSLQKASASANEAFGLMLPSVSLDTRYSELSGNNLDFGDMINPVYATLNQLIGQNRFPTDLSLKLPMKQETKIRVTQPIFAPKAFYNYRIRRNLRDSERAAFEASARELVAEIKMTYLNYAKTVKVVELYSQTLQLLDENLRVSQKLVDNQKATLDVLYRAKADLSDIQQKLSDAKRQQSDAAMYFNFLLNRPIDDDIALDPDSVIANIAIPSIDNVMRTGIDSREELMQVAKGIQASSNNVKLNSSSFVPSVAVAVDYGFQGDNYHFTSRNDNTIVSLVAQWNIFNGGQDYSRRKQAVLDTDRLKLQKDEIRRQIELQIRQAYDALIVAQQAQATSNDRLQSAKKSFEIVSRRYSEGLASQIEFIDARTNYTSSGINQILTNYDFVQKYVQLERAAALFELPTEITNNNNKGE